MTAVLHVLPHRGGGAETYLDLLERLDGVTHERLALSSARTPLAAGPSILGGYPALLRAAGEADVVHAHGDVGAFLALPVLRGRHSVWTTHGLHMLRRRPAFGKAVAAVIAATQVTLCCSHAERDELAALTPHHDRLQVVPNGVDVPAPGDRAAARAALGLGEERVALFVGALEERKDPLTAVLAAAQAGITLLVAGDGPLAGELTGARLLGHRDDVPSLLDAADVFVNPAHREGIAFAVLEAMARGVAPVVSDGPGNPEAVGDAGVVVPAGDVDAFAAALQREDLAELGAAARERVRTEFPVSRLLDGVTAAYETLGSLP